MKKALRGAESRISPESEKNSAPANNRKESKYNQNWKKLALGESYTHPASPVSHDLVIGNANSQSEEQARRMAERVSGRDPEGGETYLSGSDTGKPAPHGFSDGLKQQLGRGEVLPEGLSRSMQHIFQHDFSAVRIHTGENSHNLARQIHARAFTFGQNIFFSQGAYDPDSRVGRERLAHELTHTIQQGVSQNLVQREPIDEDDEFSKPPPIDTETATALAVAEVTGQSASSGGANKVPVTPSEKASGPSQLTMEKLLTQPDLKRALRNMARDLGYIVNQPYPYVTDKQLKELKELGMENRLIDPVAFVAHKLGYKDSVAEARKEFVKALKGLPEKAVEGVLTFILEQTKKALSTGETGQYGPELTAYEGFPIIGEKEFEIDLMPAPELKQYPNIKFKGGIPNGRVKSNESVTVSYYVEWPKVIEDKSKEVGERRVMERWRIDVLAANGSYEVGLMGLNGWRGFSYYIRPDQSTGAFKFNAPGIPGLYQVRLVDSREVRHKVLFRVAGSG